MQPLGLRFIIFVGATVLTGCGTHSAGAKDFGSNPIPEDAGVTLDGAVDLRSPAPDLTTMAKSPRNWEQLMAYTDALHAMKYLAGFVYAVHSSSDSVEVWNAATQMHVATIPVGHVPGDLATDGSRLYVVNYLAVDFGDDYLSVVDPASQTVVASAQVSELDWGNDPDNYPVTNFPSNVTVLGQKAYVVFPTNAVPGMIPITLGSLAEGTYQPAGSGPANVAGVGDRVVVINIKAIVNFNDDDIRIQQTDGTLLQTIESGGKLHDALAIEDRVWIARAPVGGVPGELLVVNPSDGTVEHIPTAAGAYGIAEANGLLYVTCTDADRVQVYDTKSHLLVEDIDLASVAPMVVNARGIAAAPNGDIYLESDGMISLLSH